MDRNIMLNYSSTLEGSVLTLTCENEMSLNSTIDNRGGEEGLETRIRTCGECSSRSRDQ